jgi:hypothetical protein
MKLVKRLTVSLLILFFAGWALNVTVLAEEKKMSPEEKKMMELWMKYATPGENHKYLEYFAGDWDSVTKSWMKPGAEPMVEKQVVKSKMLFGGRYLKSHVKGSMMGMPAEGLMITGFDNHKKEFFSLWLDNQGTGVVMSHGKLDKSGKVRTETASWDDFMTGSKANYKMITKIIDKNTYVFEMYREGFKSMEMTYKRKQ